MYDVDDLPNGYSRLYAFHEARAIYRLVEHGGESIENIRALISPDSARRNSDPIAEPTENFRRSVLQFFNEFVANGGVPKRRRQRR